jgi:hypothetical protein
MTANPVVALSVFFFFFSIVPEVTRLEASHRLESGVPRCVIRIETPKQPPTAVTSANAQLSTPSQF